MGKLYIIVPVFKRLEHTKTFIASCNQHIDENSIIYIIVDDSPQYEHFEYFSKINNIKVLKGTGNLWWGGSINLGMQYLMNQNIENDSIVVWANNDTIIDQNLYPIQKKFLEKNPNSFFHPRVFNLNKDEIEDCGNLKSWLPLRCNYIFSQSNELEVCDLVSGRFLMSYWKNFKKIGLISSRIPHYGGDWDYSLRGKKMGINTYLVKDAICYVDEKTSGNKYRGSSFIDLLFFDIKSPQNLKYKFLFFLNHHSLFTSIILIKAEFLKTTFKFLIHNFSPNY
jgi:GT2 family glycosyltransferase